MATHVTFVGGTVLTVESDLGDVGAALSVEGKLVPLQSTFGGIFYINPAQVLYLEESKEVGAGGPATDPRVLDPEPSQPAQPSAPSAPPPPSQPPPPG